MAEPEPVSVAGAIAMLVTGLIVLIPSGLCTGLFGGGALIDMLFHPENAGDAIGGLIMVLVFGGPFVIVGILLLRRGIRGLRGK